MSFSRAQHHDYVIASAAFAVVWSQLKDRGVVLATSEASSKEWLAHILVGLRASLPDADISPIAIRQFLATVPLLFP